MIPMTSTPLKRGCFAEWSFEAVHVRPCPRWIVSGALRLRARALRVFCGILILGFLFVSHSNAEELNWGVRSFALQIDGQGYIARVVDPRFNIGHDQAIPLIERARNWLVRTYEDWGLLSPEETP